MPRIRIEYTLPDDEADYALYTISREMYSALTTIGDLMRGIEKGWQEEAEEMYNEKLFKKLYDLLDESRVWEID